MRSLFLCFAACLSLNATLFAWDYQCKGENTHINLSLSSDQRSEINFRGRDLHVVTITKEQQEQGLILCGYINDIKYRTYSVLITDDESSEFGTYLKLESSDGDEIATITCNRKS